MSGKARDFSEIKKRRKKTGKEKMITKVNFNFYVFIHTFLFLCFVKLSFWIFGVDFPLMKRTHASADERGDHEIMVQKREEEIETQN